MKCLNPRVAWSCGYKTAKDGVLSPYLTFSPREALDYFARCASSAVRVRRMRKLRNHFTEIFSRDPDCNIELVAFEMMSAHEVSIPCGSCLVCQIRKRKDMSVRLAHEASCHESCCFLTLTYDEDNVPVVDSSLGLSRGKSSVGSQTLLPRDVQLFMKRLRRNLEYVSKSDPKGFDHPDKPIRYFCCGEYGSKTKRPHYHILIFGWKPSDCSIWSRSASGKVIFRSSMIEKCWKLGHSTVQDVGSGCAKYCARYVTKKLTRTAPLKNGVCSEFFLQSVKNGGIGATWLARYASNLLTGFVNVKHGDRVSRCAIPKYYIRRLRTFNIPLYLQVRDQRITFVESHLDSKKSSFDDSLRECEVYLERIRKENESEVL